MTCAQRQRGNVPVSHGHVQRCLSLWVQLQEPQEADECPTPPNTDSKLVPVTFKARKPGKVLVHIRSG